MKRARQKGGSSKSDGNETSLVSFLSTTSRRNRKIRTLKTPPFSSVSLVSTVVLIEITLVVKMLGHHCLVDCERESVHTRLSGAVVPSITKNRVVERSLEEKEPDKSKEWYPDKSDLLPCSQNDCKNASSDRVWAFNPWSRNMYLCGQTIGPNHMTEFAGDCHDTPRVFLEEPTLGDTRPITELIEVKNFGTRTRWGKKVTEKFFTPPNCTIPCRFTDIGGMPRDLAVEGTNWRIIHTLESSAHYKRTEVQKDGWKSDTYYSTTSFKSEIPLPYCWLDMELKTPPVDYDNVIKGASFIANNCRAVRNNRTSIVKELMEIIHVDSFGKCLHNTEPPEGVDKNIKEDLQKPYLFHLAFENANVMDHITEKMWGTLSSGTLPVYMGAPNIKELVPGNSIISWHDFNSTRELGEYLKVVAADKTLYESYHKWRSEPTLPQRFVNKYNFTSTHAACRTCKWAYAKQRGLGWDHEQQDMRPLHRSRRLCFDSAGFIVEPFREITATTRQGGRSLTGGSQCHDDEDRVSKVTMMGNLKRVISFHDGVIDIVLEGSSSESYQIWTGMESAAVRLQDDLYQIQNELSRTTFVVEDNTVAAPSMQAGVLNFHAITNGTPGATKSRRIRVIMEDVDNFHEGADKAMSYYGKLMVAQFERPLQFFKSST